MVKAPLYVRDRDIEAFVLSKAEWIEATALRLKRAREKEMAARLRLESGDTLPYLGRAQTLSVVREERKRPRVIRTGERLLMQVPYEADYEYRRCALEQWYRKEAGAVIGRKAGEFSKILGVVYGDIRIKDQRSRWGSCSGKGNLNFNWRIVMAPEAVCDYVVIHELCHLRYMDHSRDFWRLVESVAPGCRQCRDWLKEHGKSLYLF